MILHSCKGVRCNLLPYLSRRISIHYEILTSGYALFMAAAEKMLVCTQSKYLFCSTLPES